LEQAMPSEFTGLEGRVAIVTGAARKKGIGRAIAHELARAGCDVVVTGTGRPPERYTEAERAAGWTDIESVAEEIRALGRRALPVVMDISDEASVAGLFDRVQSELGGVDFLINNAAASRGPDRAAVVDLPVEEWDRAMRINARGTFLMSQAFARRLLAAEKGGAIVNISSMTAKLMSPNIVAYGASKLAVHALTAGMAQELGPNGIRVNAICPGPVDPFGTSESRAGNENWTALSGRIPLRRPGDGSEVGHMATFLCSDQGAWITGQAINVDGGMVVQH
jgi:3-oxoacyl-[acyl-carrier protein] reductase